MEKGRDASTSTLEPAPKSDIRIASKATTRRLHKLALKYHGSKLSIHAGMERWYDLHNDLKFSHEIAVVYCSHDNCHNSLSVEEFIKAHTKESSNGSN